MPPGAIGRTRAREEFTGPVYGRRVRATGHVQNGDQASRFRLVIGRPGRSESTHQPRAEPNLPLRSDEFDDASPSLEEHRKLHRLETSANVAHPFAAEFDATLLNLPPRVARRHRETCINKDAGERTRRLISKRHHHILHLGRQFPARVHPLELFASGLGSACAIHVLEKVS